MADRGHAIHAGLTHKAGVAEEALLMQLHYRPDRNRLLSDLHLLPFELVVVKEVSISARV